MAADDLVFGIALDPHRAGIPVGDIALRVEKKNGVVGDALHQQLKALVGGLRQRMDANDFLELIADSPKAEDRQHHKNKHRADNADLQHLVHVGGIVSRIDEAQRLLRKEIRQDEARAIHQIFAGALSDFGRRGVTLAFLLERNDLLEFGEFLLGQLIKRSQRRGISHAGFRRLL